MNAVCLLHTKLIADRSRHRDRKEHIGELIDEIVRVRANGIAVDVGRRIDSGREGASDGVGKVEREHKVVLACQRSGDHAHDSGTAGLRLSAGIEGDVGRDVDVKGAHLSKACEQLLLDRSESYGEVPAPESACSAVNGS